MDIWSMLKAYNLALVLQVNCPKGKKDKEAKPQEEEESNLQKEENKMEGRGLVQVMKIRVL